MTAERRTHRGKGRPTHGRSTNFARERRLRELDDQAAALLEGNPALAVRTRDYLNGRVSTMKRTKKQTTLTAHDSERMLNLRVPTALLARGDALVRMVAADTELPTTGRVTRSTVFRMALIEGLKVLERRYRR
jgi:hypothetical protein